MTNYNQIEIEDITGLLEDTAMALKVTRGKFYPDKNFGSKIEKSQTLDEILANARQAVSTLDGVYVKSVEKLDNGLVAFNLTLNDEERQVDINFD